LALSSALVVLAGCALYFWLDDVRSLLYTLVAVGGVCLLFAGVAGWRMFGYGVVLEHAEGITQMNAVQQAQWQHWAQQGVAVLDHSAIFPVEVRKPAAQHALLNSEQPLLLGEFPGVEHLFTELLVPMLITLQTLVKRHSLVVHLPAGCTADDWRLFQQVWASLALPAAALDSPDYVPHSLQAQLTTLIDDNDSTRVHLLFRYHWQPDHQQTEGAVAWLLAPMSASASLKVRCVWQRTLLAEPSLPDAALEQFLHYQTGATKIDYLWSDTVTQPQVSRMIIALYREQNRAGNEALSTTPLRSPEQIYLPHWLGKSGDCSDWFAATLAMQMAEFSRGTQLLMLQDRQGASLMSVRMGGTHAI